MIRFLRKVGFVPVPELVLSQERINRAVQVERLRDLTGDVEYRDRVKQRMREGYRCPLPPLIDAEAYRQRRPAARVAMFRAPRGES